MADEAKDREKDAKKEIARQEAKEKVAKAVTAKPEQASLPGMEPKKIADVEKANEQYVEARDARMAAGDVEVELKDKLIAAMQKHGLKKYKRGPHEIAVTAKYGVKAKIKDDSTKEGKE